MHCPYEYDRKKDEDGAIAQCMVLSVACGFVVSNEGRICAGCIKNEYWNAAKVPQLKADDVERAPSKADAMALVSECDFFARLYAQSLRSRLVGGDCQRYQDGNPVDLSAAFTQFRTAKGDGEAQDLLAEMLDVQIQKAKTLAADVDDEATVRNKIATLAEENSFVTALEAEDIRDMK